MTLNDFISENERKSQILKALIAEIAGEEKENIGWNLHRAKILQCADNKELLERYNELLK